MKSLTSIPSFGILILILIIISNKIYSQDGLNSGISSNKPLTTEFESQNNINVSVTSEAIELERKHKEAIESGNLPEASKLEMEINNSLTFENKYITIPESPEVRKEVEKIKSDPEQTDWLTTNSAIFSGQTKSSSALHKQVEVDFGEDNYLYAVINGVGYGSLVNGYFYIYKSSDYGQSWSYVLSVGTGPYIGNISMSVESKSNAHPDSTRIIVYYTSSWTADNANAELKFYSARSNASGILSGVIATPSAGKTFTHISSVSDGAFWQSATYFGVVCTEADNITGDTYRTRFFRTVDWGVTWASASINTSFNDLYPSAEYKEGTADSVYIAVERKFDAAHSEIRILATPWQPTGNINTYYITNTSGIRYANPSLTIKQDGNADSILITCTKNGSPLYHFTPNGGGIWYTDYTIAPSNGINKSFTFCSSSRTGTSPFTACWVSDDGDSINVRRGVLGNLGASIYKVNNQFALSTSIPVCATIPAPSSAISTIVYAAWPLGVYSAQEGNKIVNIKTIPQGFYDPAANDLNMKDTLRLYIRNSAAPYNIIDSGKAVFDSAGSFNASFQFTSLSDGNYYFSVKHRNSIETWSFTPVNLVMMTGLNDYNFMTAASTAYGNNLIQVDASPVRFAMYSGDVNQDGIVEATDMGMIDNDAYNFTTGYVRTDLTGDNIIDASDAAIADNNAYNFVTVAMP